MNNTGNTDGNLRSAYPTLPPIGAIGEGDHADAWTYLQGLVQEAIEGRQAWVDQADSNLNIYLWGQDPPPDDTQLVLNEIQNAIIADTDIQTKEPPSVTLEPVESGEIPTTFWVGPDAAGLQLGLPPECVAHSADPATGQIVAPPAPIAPDAAEQIHQMIAGGVLPEQYILDVDDKLISEVAQSVFDVYWARAQMDRRNREFVLDTNVVGWSFRLYEFDDASAGGAKGHRFRELSVKQVYIDPTVSDISDAAYGGVDLVLPAEQAKMIYPQLSAKIDAESHEGAPTRSDANVNYGQAFNTRNFRRPMTVLRIFWLRNQECLYSPQDAVAGGLVEQRSVPAAEDGSSDGLLQDYGAGVDAGGTGVRDAIDPSLLPEAPGMAAAAPAGGSGSGRAAELPGAGAAGDTDNAADGGDAVARGDAGDNDAGDSDQDTVPAAAAGETSPDAGAGIDGVGSGPDHGLGTQAPGSNSAAGGGAIGAADPVAPPIPMRVAHFVPGTDQEITPEHPAWPTYTCLRQITAIAGVVVDDRVCEHWDIPLVHNVNIPVPGRPYGLGEPMRLKKLQDARSRMVEAMVMHCEQFKYPMGAMPASMYRELVAEYGSARLKPGETLIIPDELWERFSGKVDVFYDPPEISPSMVNLQQMLGEEITQQSGYADVLQGRAQPQVKSGKAIELLQTSAASMIGFKSQRTGDAVEREARLMLHSLVRRLSPDEVGKIVKKYPPHVLAAIWEKSRDIEWDVNVTISSGNGAMRNQKKQEAMTLHQQGLLDTESAQEACNLDVPLIRRRMQEQAAAQAKAAAAAAPMQPQPARSAGAP